MMLKRLILIVTFIGLPLSFFGDYLGWSPTMMFGIYALTIVALATYMGRATESVAILIGPRLGGLMNATFGNAVELIISIFTLKAGYIAIVLASMTGAVIGNLLFVSGLSFLIGGLKNKRQKFNIYDARHHAGLLMFGVIVAFIFPHIFAAETTESESMVLSVTIAIVMIFLYFAGLVFRLFSQRGVYPVDSGGGDDPEDAEWSKRRAMTILIAATVGVAFVSEKLVHTFEAIGEAFGWTELFIGVIAVAIIGNAAEHASAVYMAYKNKMNVAIEIAIGSCIQIAMFVAPFLVLLSLFFPTPMPLIFTVQELVAMVLAALLTITMINDGDTNWFEGATLLAAYVIMGVGFYLL